MNFDNWMKLLDALIRLLSVITWPLVVLLLILRGDQTPYIIYAGSRAAADQEQARAKGAVGCTNRPDELFGMVLSVLGRA